MNKKLLVKLALIGALGFTSQAYADGQAVYEETCVACHGEDGKGAEGMEGVPNFANAPAIWAKSDDELTQSVINGVEREGAETTMPPRAGNDDLSDGQIKEAVVFIRKNFGG